VREFVQRGGCLLGDDPEQVAVAGGQHIGEGVRRGEPDLRLPG
jgi:hypothetical protein